MPTCKVCNCPIKGKGKTGMCSSCAKKIKNVEMKKNQHCISCGDPISDSNKSGQCVKCWHSKGGNTNVKRQDLRVRAICWNSHCRKEFYARADQHPKYSLCPTCAAAKKLMSRNGRWTQDTMFSNSAE